MKKIAIFAWSLALGACAGSREATVAPPAPQPTPQPPPASAPSRPALGYGISSPATIGYEMLDTVTIAMEAGGQNVQIDVKSRIGAAVDLAPAGGGVRATVRVTTIDATATNSMGPTTAVDSGDLPGPAELTVNANGEVSIVRKPEFSQDLQRVTGPVDLYHRFFMRMPKREVARNAAWTDTVTTNDVAQGLNTETLAIITSVWERDTTVAGRTLNVITSRITSTTRVRGTTEGVEIAQTLNGQTTATTLWDPVRRMIAERRDVAEGTGTTDLPGMGITGLPTTFRSRSVLRSAGT
ncbi:MAG: hypothetical protein ACREMQ_08735 [Longimicrobiales bacterium]